MTTPKTTYVEDDDGDYVWDDGFREAGRFEPAQRYSLVTFDEPRFDFEPVEPGDVEPGDPGDGVEPVERLRRLLVNLPPADRALARYLLEEVDDGN